LPALWLSHIGKEGKDFWAKDHGIECGAIRNTLGVHIKNFGSIMENPLRT